MTPLDPWRARVYKVAHFWRSVPCSTSVSSCGHQMTGRKQSVISWFTDMKTQLVHFMVILLDSDTLTFVFTVSYSAKEHMDSFEGGKNIVISCCADQKKYRKSIRFIDCIHLSFFKTLHPQMQDIPSDLGCVTLYIFLIAVCVWLNSRGFWFMHIENIQRSLRSSEKRKTAFLLNGLSLSTWKTQISVIYFPT